ncbi:MAG: helix-turn-helix transcriptional regulator [Acidihalobacter sp.]|uniref:AraC family transcriptional regulator n=1 Tax=Acidihalobacter sp. TaxID=1872108 RepID=UPI00307E6ACF
MPGHVKNQVPAETPSTDRLTTIEDADCPVLLLPNRLSKGLHGTPHNHRKGQLIYPIQGRFRVRTVGRIWVGSPQQAMWIPPGVVHQVEALDDLDVHNVYVRTEEIEGLPSACKVLNVPPLLRELLTFGLTLPTSYQQVTEHLRIMLAITDQIRLADDMANLHLPTSDDRRLRPILSFMIEHPDDNRSLEDWADFTNSSTRTLARLFIQETGLTFRQWRQRLRMMEALPRLSDGQSVLTVSMDLGYASQSAFATVFRKIIGQLPSEFALRGRYDRLPRMVE